MSAQPEFTPFSAERQSLSAMLEGLARKLSTLHDTSLDGLLSGDFKMKLVRELLPDRRLIFEAHQVAYALRCHRPVDDPRDDLPHLFEGNIKCLPGDELNVAMSAECDDIKKALGVFLRLLDAFERATVAND